jgi:hypothetical protein
MLTSCTGRSPVLSRLHAPWNLAQRRTPHQLYVVHCSLASNGLTFFFFAQIKIIGITGAQFSVSMPLLTPRCAILTEFRH